MQEELLEELYLLILSKGPGYMNYSNIEFWDPTLETIELYEEILERSNDA